MVIVEHLRIGASPERWDQSFSARCANGHDFVVSVDDYENSWFEPDNLECSLCGQPPVAVEPDEVRCECPFCREEFELSVSEMHVATHRCYGGLDTDAYHAVGSSSFYADLVGDVWESRAPDTVHRERRKDFWNILTHFTCLQAFISILRSGTIEARPTGYFGSRIRSPEERSLSKAVCLTETPWEFDAEIRARFGEFGFGFEKSRLMALSCGPVLNIPEGILTRHRDAVKRDLAGRSRSLVHGWHVDLVPFVNKVAADFDFHHEREWRVPQDIELEQCRPWLLLPEDYEQQLRASGVQNREMAAWLHRYGRARVVGPEHWLAGPHDE